MSTGPTASQPSPKQDQRFPMTLSYRRTCKRRWHSLRTTRSDRERAALLCRLLCQPHRASDGDRGAKVTQWRLCVNAAHRTPVYTSVTGTRVRCTASSFPAMGVFHERLWANAMVSTGLAPRYRFHHHYRAACNHSGLPTSSNINCVPPRNRDSNAVPL